MLDLIKGRRVEKALDTLLFAKKGIARQLYKLLRSAVENANDVTPRRAWTSTWTGRMSSAQSPTIVHA